MNALDRTKPYISMERGNKAGVYAIHFVKGDSLADVAIIPTGGDKAVLDYFYERLKDGLNLD